MVIGIIGIVLGGNDYLRERAREHLDGTYPDTAVIYRPASPVPSDDFGSNSAFSLLSDSPANYWSITGREALVLERMDVRAEAIVALPALTDITEQDQIIYTVTETGKIHHFAVSFVYDRTRGQSLRCAVVEYKFET